MKILHSNQTRVFLAALTMIFITPALRAQQTYCEKICYMKMVSTFPRISADISLIREVKISAMNEPVLISKPGRKKNPAKQSAPRKKSKEKQAKEKRARIAKMLYV